MGNSIRTDTCEHCGTEFPIHDATNGSFCSLSCYHRFKGRKLLNTIYNDHTQCSCCGTKVKGLEPPKHERDFDIRGGAWDLQPDGSVEYTAYGQDVTYQAATEREYATPDAEYGEKTAWRHGNVEGITKGIVCGTCGNASLFSPQEDIRRTHLFEHASRILDSLRERKADGEFECDINEREVFRILVDIPDLALAIGVART